MTTPDTPAATEGLRGRLMEAGARVLDSSLWQRVGREEAHRHDELAAAVVHAIFPLIEAELQKRDEEKARWVAKLREKAAQYQREARLDHEVGFYAWSSQYSGQAKGVEEAAQMLEESAL